MIADEAKQFWSAALFWRRAKDRDARTAIRIINHLTKSLAGPIAARARKLKKEIEHERSSESRGG